MLMPDTDHFVMPDFNQVNAFGRLGAEHYIADQATMQSLPSLNINPSGFKNVSYIMECLWLTIFSGCAKAIKFKSMGAQLLLKKVSDTHKGWEFMQVVYPHTR
jgi:hypothetical protein